MKKIYIFTAAVLFLTVVQPVCAVGNGRFGQELRDLKNEIKSEMENNNSTSEGRANFNSITPALKHQVTLQDQIIEKLKKHFPKLLPAGVNKAEIISISQTTLPAEIKVKHDDKNMTLKINEKTLILRKFGGKSSLSELNVGDLISARGTWENKDEAILQVRVLRDLSLQKRHGSFWGKIKSPDSNKNTFILETAKRGEQKVFVQLGTKIVSRDQKSLNFSDLAVGHRVRVTGVWDPKLKQINETKTIKDWSIGPAITPKEH